MLQPCGTSSEIRIARGTALTSEFYETKLGEFGSAFQVLATSLVMNGKLLAGVDPVVSIGNYLLPDFRRAVVFAPAFRHQREFAPRLWAELSRESNL